MDKTIVDRMPVIVHCTSYISKIPALPYRTHSAQETTYLIISKHKTASVLSNEFRRGCTVLFLVSFYRNLFQNDEEYLILELAGFGGFRGFGAAGISHRG